MSHDDREMQDVTATREPPDDVLAPRGHTAALVGLYLAVAATGVVLQGRGTPPVAVPSSGGRVVAMYLPLLVVQWGITLYVCRVGRARNVLGDLLGARWTSIGRAVGDVALAAGGWVAIKAVELAWVSVFASGVAPAVTSLLPQSLPERLMWAAVAVSVGFCEEVVFRGYLQRQFEGFWGKPWLAVGLQALLFGVAHGEQGASAVARAALYGVGFGALARWRRSLVPGILCHAWTDLASGLLRGV